MAAAGCERFCRAVADLHRPFTDGVRPKRAHQTGWARVGLRRQHQRQLRGGYQGTNSFRAFSELARNGGGLKFMRIVGCSSGCS